MAKLNDLKFRVWDDRDRTWGNPPQYGGELRR